MGKLTTWCCDNCGVLKKETNGWWVLDYYSTELHLRPLPDGESGGKGTQSLTLCGQSCVLQKVAEFMGGEFPK